ncbi:MAG: flagellar protein FlgN [Lachnospiraceae bacterium]|nr:flagellar protein FlgN [Lachnospiraceae bacterium]
MASLVEELLDVMGEETQGYEKLYTLSEEKRQAIVHRDLEGMESVVAKENDITSDLKNLENKRAQILKDMSVVLGKDDETLTVTQVILLLSKQPKEHAVLTEARDNLVKAATNMQFLNEQNQILLNQAMEMVEFDLTLFKSMRQAPETANYDKNAYNTGDILPSGGFDAKQ